MDKLKVKGKANQAAGKVREGVGGAVGNDKMEQKGRTEAAKGKMQSAAGSVRESAKDAARKVKSAVRR
jgi:uncharacterized protein YjbJ (UPF0337 family)